MSKTGLYDLHAVPVHNLRVFQKFSDNVTVSKDDKEEVLYEIHFQATPVFGYKLLWHNADWKESTKLPKEFADQIKFWLIMKGEINT